MTATVSEIAPDIFRIATFVPEFDLQFCQFLVRDDEPFLYHTGMRGLFPGVRDAVARLVDPADLRWIGYSHFEADECGALNDWLAVAPRAEPVCGLVAGLVNLQDFALRAPRLLDDGEVLATGRYRLRYLRTPHLPHGWDAGLMYEETTGALFCSDLFNQAGDVEAFSDDVDIVGRFEAGLVAGNEGPFANFLPYNALSAKLIAGLADLRPEILLPMHGTAWRGDGAAVLQALDGVLRRAAVQL